MRRSRRPSTSTAISLLALFVALGGSSYAAVKIDGGDVRNNSLTGKDVKNSSLTGKDVRNDRLSGADVKESSLATVPRAANANSAASANRAGNADTVGGRSAASFVSASRIVSTNGLRKLEVGRQYVLRSAPFAVAARCVSTGGNETALQIDLASTEPGSGLDGSYGQVSINAAGTGGGTAAFVQQSQHLELAAPSGATLDLFVQYGVNGIGLGECFFSANGFAAP